MSAFLALGLLSCGLRTAGSGEVARDVLAESLELVHCGIGREREAEVDYVYLAWYECRRWACLRSEVQLEARGVAEELRWPSLAAEYASHGP